MVFPVIFGLRAAVVVASLVRGMDSSSGGLRMRTRASFASTAIGVASGCSVLGVFRVGLHSFAHPLPRTLTSRSCTLLALNFDILQVDALSAGRAGGRSSEQHFQCYPCPAGTVYPDCLHRPQYENARWTGKTAAVENNAGLKRFGKRNNMLLIKNKENCL